MTSRLLSPLLCLLLPPIAGAQTAPQAGPGTPLVQTEATPALWKVTGQHGTAYLFGTVHVMRKEVHWETPRVASAFKASDVLYLEVPATDDPQAKDAVLEGMKLGNDPDHPLSTKLSKQDLARVDEFLKPEGLAEQSIDSMRPWLAYLALSLMPALQAGYSPTSGVDTTLAMEAKSQAKPVKGLETFDEQFHLLSTFPEAQQLELLHEEIEDLPKAIDQMNEIVADWTHGDVDKIAALDEAEFKKHPELYDKLVTGRNLHFADAVGALLSDPATSTVFVAVGAGHLAGPASVEALLTKRGFTVIRVE